MAVVRAQHRMGEGLPELQHTEAGRTGMFLGIDQSLEPENDENAPMLGSANVHERASARRSFPRLPLQDISHLSSANGLTSLRNDTRNVRLAYRVRRRPLESPVLSKKRRLSEASSPAGDTLSRPASKGAKTSTSLRCFR